MNSSTQKMTQTGEFPARGGDAVEILVNDHQTIKRLLDQLTSGGDTTRRTTLEQLKGILTIHNATEENLVYPALALVAGKNSEAQHLYHETAAADLLVFELDTLLRSADDDGFIAKAKKLQAAIVEHIDDEENKAFPDLQKHADASQTQQLAQDVRTFRSALRFENQLV